MASVRIERKSFNDPRFKFLAKRLGVSLFDAVGRMAFVWSYCTEHETYFITPEAIDIIAEFENFSEVICEQNIGLGEKTSKGIRIRGTRGRIEWLAKLRKNSIKGGLKTRAKWQAKEGPEGQPRGRPDEGPPTTVPVTVTVNKNKRKKAVRATALQFDLEFALKQYPIHRRGPGCDERFSEQIKTQSDYDDLLRAIENYKVDLANNTWRAAKQTFTTFLGPKDKPYWRDFIMPITNQILNKASGTRVVPD